MAVLPPPMTTTVSDTFTFFGDCLIFQYIKTAHGQRKILATDAKPIKEAPSPYPETQHQIET